MTRYHRIGYTCFIGIAISLIACSSTRQEPLSGSTTSVTSSIDLLLGRDLTSQTPLDYAFIDKNIYQEHESQFRYVIHQYESAFYFLCLYSINGKNGLAVAEYSDSENAPVWRDLVENFVIDDDDPSKILVEVNDFDETWPQYPFNNLTIKIQKTGDRIEALVNGEKAYVFDYSLRNVDSILKSSFETMAFSIGDLNGDIKPVQVGFIYQVIETLGVKVVDGNLKQKSFPEWIIQQERLAEQDKVP